MILSIQLKRNPQPNTFILDHGMKKKDKPKKKNEYREYDSFEKSRRKSMRVSRKKSKSWDID